MRRRQEKNVHSSLFHPLPREALKRQPAVAGQLRINLREVLVRTVAVAAEQQRLLHTLMPGQQAYQLEAGIPGRSEHRGLNLLSQLLYSVPRLTRTADPTCDLHLSTIHSPLSTALREI